MSQAMAANPFGTGADGAGDYISPLPTVYFPAAKNYRDWLHKDPDHLQEAAVRRKAFAYTERHLHCVWHDPHLRPASLTTRAGEPVIVEHPGLWNQEAGPDFLGAVLKIGPGERRVEGDVEMHIHPADWRAHGHATDRRYRNVRFHVTYFPGADTDWPTVPGAIHIVLKPALQANPAFAFDQIDPAAYPYGARADRPPCSLVLRRFTVDERRAVLRAAGEERLRRKAERLHGLIVERGEEQTLYEEIMTALGYKHNKRACRDLAQRVPIAELRRTSKGHPRIAYALLMGVAGLLPKQPAARWSEESKQYVRSLWDEWWRFRDRFGPAMPPAAWRLDGVRPTNHPHRRLMAAAYLALEEPSLPQWLKRTALSHPDQWMSRWIERAARITDPYWSHRLALAGQARTRATALLGPERAAAMLANILIPYLAATGCAPAVVARALDHLPQEPINSVIKQTAHYLFGRDHSPSLYASALARQGLIQIFHDFCLNDRSRCATCTFPATLQAHHDRNKGG